MKNISVICSNYNSDLWIDDYLNCLNYQKDASFEVVFVDALSTDKSLEKIKNYKFKSNIDIKIIECNYKLGLYAAWNLAIKSCDSKYVMNYNTDDLLFDYAIQTYESWIQKDPYADIIFGPFGMTESRNIYDIKYLAKWPSYSHERLLYEYMCGPFPLFKKKVFNEIGYFDESFISAGDYEMVARMSKLNYKFRQIDECVGCFYDRSDSLSNRDKNLVANEIKRVKDKYI